MQGLYLLYEIFGILSGALTMMIVIMFIISLLFVFNVVSPSNQFLMSFYQAIQRLLDPLLRPIRNLLPDTGAVDLSPLVLIIGVQILDAVLRSAILSLA